MRLNFIHNLLIYVAFGLSLCGCKTSHTHENGNEVYVFSSKKTATQSQLDRTKSAQSYDSFTGITYLRVGKKWHPLISCVGQFDHIKRVVASEGQIIESMGFYQPGDGGGAKFKVVKTSDRFSPGLNTIPLSNGLMAVRIFEGRANVLAFGAKGNTQINGKGEDDTKAIQAAIDFIKEHDGGEVYIPGRDKSFYKISNIYVENGIHLKGDIVSISQEENRLIGSNILVDNEGQGIIIGEKEYHPRKRVNGVIVEQLGVQGMANSRSGIRIGSDLSFITPVNVVLRHCVIEGFTNSSTSQVIYDKTTPALGMNDANFPGTFPVVGACGIFIAGGISVKLEHVVSQRNYYGLYESSGGFCTALGFSGGAYRENIKNGIVLTTVKSTSFSDMTVIETNGEEGLKLIAPKTDIPSLKHGPTSVFIENIHMEHNNFRRDNGYSILIDNQNDGYYIDNVSITNCRLDFYQYNGVYINRGRNVSIASNQILVIPTQTQIYTTNSESIEYVGPVIGNMELDQQTRVIRKSKEALNSTSGNVVADYRAKATRSNKEESLIIQGDLALLPDHLTADNGSFKIQAWGKFGNNSNRGQLTMRFNNQNILDNRNIQSTAGKNWYAEVIISANKVQYPNDVKTFGRLQIGNDFEAPQITNFTDKNCWEKINRIYISGKGAAGIVLEGYHVSYEAF